MNKYIKYNQIIILGLLTILYGEEPLSIGFWNVENLFDLENDPNKNDDEFAIGGRKSVNQKIYDWAVINLTEEVVSNYFKDIALGGVKRYLMDNINAINYILSDSLDGGGSESLLNDAQGKTHGQIMLMLVVDIPENIIEGLNE